MSSSAKGLKRTPARLKRDADCGTRATPTQTDVQVGDDATATDADHGVGTQTLNQRTYSYSPMIQMIS